MRTRPTPVPLALLLLAGAAHAAPEALIIHEYSSFWESGCTNGSAIQEEMKARGITYSVIGTADLATWDLRPYNMIFLSSCQTDTLYNEWNAHRQRYGDWAKLGGLLAVHGAWDCAATIPPLPPGPVPNNTKAHAQEGKVLLPAHPLMAQVNQPATGGALSHESYLSTGHPGDVPLITDTATGDVLYFVRPAGAGLITYGGLTSECYTACGNCGFGDSGQVMFNEIDVGTAACDEDGDGVGDPPCCDDDDHDGYGECEGDCDDFEPAAHPKGTEVICTGIDEDCDESTPDMVDDDADGVCNTVDLCPGYDDTADVDADGMPDACDDSDRDGLTDAEEGSGDADGDDLPDWNDPDSDNDGSVDGREAAEQRFDDAGDGLVDHVGPSSYGFGCQTAPAGLPAGLVAMLTAVATASASRRRSRGSSTRR